MAEYIEREAAIKRMEELHFGCKDFHICGGVLLELNALKAIPAADVRPVVRGKWEKTASNLYDICPICREPFSNRDILGVTQNKNFCPNCGAQMEVEHD